MTTIYNSPAAVSEPTACGTHVLIVGVGAYPALLGGDDGQLLDNPMGLKQLSSPPLSARALATWFLGREGASAGSLGFRNPSAPLATVEMLLSPAQKYTRPDGKEVEVEPARRASIAQCFARWGERAAAHDDNVAVFYFCGHGLMGTNDYLLPSDFGLVNRGNPWADAIDITETARAMRRLGGGALYFFIDACRQAARDALSPGASPPALAYVDFAKPVRGFNRLILWATGEGQEAFGTAGKVSRFTAALTEALLGYEGEEAPEGGGWMVTGEMLARSVRRILEKANASLEPSKRQYVEQLLIGSQPFHFETERPRQVAAGMASAWSSGPAVRQMLKDLDVGKALPANVLEVLAEHLEAKNLQVEALQKDVKNWTQRYAELAQRLAIEPDSLQARQAQELLQAGRLDEAGTAIDSIPSDDVAGFVCVTERGPSGVTIVRSFEEYAAIFGSILPEAQSYSGFAVRGFFENGGRCACVARALGQGARSAQACVWHEAMQSAITLSAVEVGSFGNRLEIEIALATRKGLRVAVRYVASSNGSPASGAQSLELENFDNIQATGDSLDLGLIESINRHSQWVWISSSADVLHDKLSVSGVRVDPPAGQSPPPLGVWTLSGGADGEVSAASLLGEDQASTDLRMRTGLGALSTSPDIGLICIPDIAQPWLTTADRQRTLAALLDHCSTRQITAVLSAGSAKDPLLQVQAPCDSAFAIAAWPWLSVASPVNEQQVVVPPDGHVAGAIARSDRTKGLHKSLVACQLVGASATVPCLFTGADELRRAALEADHRGFNLIGSVEGQLQIFSHPAVTTALNEEHRDATHVRLLRFIGRRIEQGLTWTIFELQSDQLKQRIYRHVEEFLKALWSIGVLAGRTPEETFHVEVEQEPERDDSRPSPYVLSVRFRLGGPKNYWICLTHRLPDFY